MKYIPGYPIATKQTNEGAIHLALNSKYLWAIEAQTKIPRLQTWDS